MTFSLAILLIIILLLYDVIFLRLLLKRNGRIRFKLIIHNGVIIETEGKVPERFYQQVKLLCEEYQPVHLSIKGKQASPKDLIEFSYPINEDLKEKLEQAFMTIGNSRQ